MQKAIIIGCPGSGKSTFARKLRDVTNLPLYYLDMLWHRSDQTNIPRAEFDARLGEIMKTNQWIIDGNYGRTLEWRLGECDTVFLMDFPLDVCLSGAESRVGRKREDMPWVESELDEEFKQCILGFQNRELSRIYELLHKYQESRTVVIFKSREEAESYLEKIAD